ncbi:MAG: hypothetical protein L0210_03955 [Rhodospirillales bacterium]|nr:hypothetical protein [Rhodospirillales bacterium]
MPALDVDLALEFINQEPKDRLHRHLAQRDGIEDTSNTVVDGCSLAIYAWDEFGMSPLAIPLSGSFQESEHGKDQGPHGDAERPAYQAGIRQTAP